MTDELQRKANRRHSKLPSDWRETYGGGDSSEDFLHTAEFHIFVRGLDRISREHLFDQLAEEAWNRVNKENPDFT